MKPGRSDLRGPKSFYSCARHRWFGERLFRDSQKRRMRTPTPRLRICKSPAPVCALAVFIYPEHLQLLEKWLIEHEVEEVVMESTAQYWKPAGRKRERYWKHSCQTRSRC